MKRLALAIALLVAGPAVAGGLPPQYLPPVPLGTEYMTAHMGLLGLGWFPARKSTCGGRMAGACEAVYTNQCGEAFALRVQDGRVVGSRHAEVPRRSRAALCAPIEGRD